jgi:hypothetical protein
MSNLYPGISFVVEDGTGLTNSNSYVTTAFATTYATQNGFTDWLANTDISIAEMALMKATQSIDILYGQEYYGIPMQQGQNNLSPGVPYIQNLLFPRFTFVVNNIQLIQSGVIPLQLQRAVCEVAEMWYGGGAMNDATIFPQPNLLKYTADKTTKVGSISSHVKFGKTPDAERYPGFWKVDKILFPILRKSNNPTYLSF